MKEADLARSEKKENDMNWTENWLDKNWLNQFRLTELSKMKKANIGISSYIRVVFWVVNRFCHFKLYTSIVLSD